MWQSTSVQFELLSGISLILPQCHGPECQSVHHGDSCVYASSVSGSCIPRSQLPNSAMQSCTLLAQVMHGYDDDDDDAHVQIKIDTLLRETKPRLDQDGCKGIFLVRC